MSFQAVVKAQIVTPDEYKGVLTIQQFDTRSLALGSATVSDLYGRASFGINPALSGLYQNNFVLQANSNHIWNTNLIQHSLTLPTLSIDNHHFTVRVGMVNQGFEELDFFGNSRLPEPDVKLYHAQAAYAYSITDVFSLGVLQSVTYSFNQDARYWTYFADIGILYAPAKNISYGMVFRGLGHESNYEIIETGVTTLGSNLMQQSLELGATFRFPIEERTYMSISFANEKRFGESGIWYKGGLELMPNSILALRGGAIFHVGQSKFIPRAGIGLNFKYGSLNYMASPKNMDGEYFHQIGLTIQL
ncbi:MAG: hypothetical protein JJU37_06405 [Balneolaceae bacterium]|nr:hypothetical protein [Balneolaceae bacterium]